MGRDVEVLREARAAAIGPWEGSDEDLPLARHFDRLRGVGFVAPECFWRGAGDAIYGAFRG